MPNTFLTAFAALIVGAVLFASGMYTSSALTSTPTTSAVTPAPSPETVVTPSSEADTRSDFEKQASVLEDDAVALRRFGAGCNKLSFAALETAKANFQAQEVGDPYGPHLAVCVLDLPATVRTDEQFAERDAAERRFAHWCIDQSSEQRRAWPTAPPDGLYAAKAGDLWCTLSFGYGD
ncbi:MAG: hypothetical protein M3O70_00830 [Actinomycetota bacterium]|nr:hypothetical protein [Actinomycetota bacterium]